MGEDRWLGGWPCRQGRNPRRRGALHERQGKAVLLRNAIHAFTPLDEFGFHHTLAGTHGLALVIFTSAGCGSCRAWKQLLTANRAQHPDLALFEVDAGHAQALAREFGVFHLPALFLYRDGHFHSPLQSETHPDKLRAAIEAALAAPAQEQP